MQDIFNDMDKVLAKFSDDMREMFKNYHREEVKEEVDEEVFPKAGDKYWCVDIIGNISSETYVYDDEIDNYRRSINNVFKTEEEAEQHRRFLLADAKLRRLADGGVFYIVYYKEDKRFAPYNNKCNIFNHYGFSMREKAVEAIKEIGEDDLKLIFGIKE